MKKWFYSLYKLKMEYKIDKGANVAIIDINKPVEYVGGDEADMLESMKEHFSNMAYFVIVRD